MEESSLQEEKMNGRKAQRGSLRGSEQGNKEDAFPACVS